MLLKHLFHIFYSKVAPGTSEAAKVICYSHVLDLTGFY
jgi:hypothetical protein